MERIVMRDLTVTQEYFVCASAKNGKISGTERVICFVAAGLFELALDDLIHFEKKCIVPVTGTLPDEKSMLAPLFQLLVSKKNVTVEKLAEEYAFSFTDANLNALFTSVGESLVHTGYAQRGKGGVFGRKTLYLPQREAVDRTIDKLRAELLEDCTVTEESALLINLLQKANLLKFYFSKYEQAQIPQKLKLIAASESGKKIQEMMDSILGMIAIATTLSTTH
jgi:hypothetical protein